jgi:hypothetical protein
MPIFATPAPGDRGPRAGPPPLAVEVESMTRVLLVRVSWDREANVWVADSGEIPGLATEAEAVEM